MSATQIRINGSLLDVQDLLTAVETSINYRQLRLFACAVARSGSLPAEAWSNSVEVGERYADGKASDLDIAVAWGRANHANRPIDGRFTHNRWTVMAATSSAHSTNLLEAIQQWVVNDDGVILLDIVGDRFNNFGPADRFPTWRTAEAQMIAEEVYAKRCPVTGKLDSALLAILADCLEDRACVVRVVCPRCRGKDYYAEGDRMSNMFPEPCPRCGRSPHSAEPSYVSVPHPMLAHLRDKQPHYRGCWALDFVLARGK